MSSIRERAERLATHQGQYLGTRGEDIGLCTAFVLRVTGPEMRERIRKALAEGPLDCRPWDEIDGCADVVMALICEGTP